MSYTKTVWIDDQAPAIDAINLNHIEDGIYNAHDSVDKIISGAITVGHATSADSANSIVGGFPAGPVIGGITLWPSASIPSGYLECNGQTLPRSHALFSVLGTTYGNGDGVTTFNIPDLRGVFIRGWDHGRGMDYGRALGSFQDWAMERIHGAMTYLRGSAIAGTSGPFYNAGPSGQGGSGTGANDALGFDSSRQVKTANETRPSNVAMIYIIKAS